MKRYETRYRVVDNKASNDFNNYLPLTIVAYDYDTETKLIRRKGFNGWHSTERIHYLFHDRIEAEECLVNRINNDWWGVLKFENKKLKTENIQLKSEQNKVAVEKLEELKLKLRKLEFQQISTFEAINSMIKELKGE